MDAEVAAFEKLQGEAAALRERLKLADDLAHALHDLLISADASWEELGAGHESGPGARPFDLAWARSTVAQCKAAGVPVFCKQLGTRPIVADSDFGQLGPYTREAEDGSNEIRLRDRKGGEIQEWPRDLRIREFPR